MAQKIGHKPRKEMIAETKGKLIAAARRAFATRGYAEASMDDFTAEAGLTRGALYHHFGDKKGLFQAVIAEIDAEMSDRLCAISSKAQTAWQGFVDENIAYIEMALEPEIQRIMLLDGPAVLGDPSSWPNQNACIRTMTASIQKLMDEGTIRDVDAEATARLVNGATLSAALWIASAEDPQAVSKKAVGAFLVMVSGLLKEKAGA
ncbi:AcrR family transcriptional regulator [Rhizobium petrolearium]|uniref:TetR/AcrR family transcriptional regulator n=2 Tax=Neorhizobium TaxID=1525371 RepID=A0ABV0M0E2_9HYPH|nr:TetR/AcrR family transcriptional regulator [Neorhizobium petrolearium]MBP1843700.1 AcrR family transcriptional regulator [Neorhizobium petrolearium]MCC2609146.1 TetR/AcrR family transcriptional regulator [Neorhizobium petrolearium]WGI69376.1 TetR/AcrR family transcriptional regulator [Neorhizobium petrolearium]